MTTEYKFKFGFTPSLSGFSNMEIDRYLIALERLSFPIVRFYTWKSATISYGLNQNPLKRLKIGKCLQDGIEIVVRPTGGREILHGWDLCLSVISPISRNCPGIDFAGSFDDINEILRRGLCLMGIEGAEYHSVSKKSIQMDGPCFSQIDRGEISVSGKKIIASAQRIYDKAILQQSSIAVKRPESDLVDYLQIRNESEMRGKIVNSVAYLEDVLDETFSIPEIVEVIKGAFKTAMGKSEKLELPKIF